MGFPFGALVYGIQAGHEAWPGDFEALWLWNNFIIHRARHGLRMPYPAPPVLTGTPGGLKPSSTYLPHTSSPSGPGGSGRCSLGRRAGSHRWRRAHRPLGDTQANEEGTEVAWETVGS